MPPALRILHVIHTLDPKMGGPVESVYQLGSQFTSQGHTVEVVSSADVQGSEFVEQFPVQVWPQGPAYARYAYSPRIRPWLEANIDRYDVLIINGVWQNHTRVAARIARAHGIPYFVYAHGLLDPWNRGAHPIRYLKKALYWFAIERNTLRHARAVVFTSDEERRLAGLYLPFAAWNSLVVGHGIRQPPKIGAEDKDRFFASFPHLRGKRMLLFLSRIHQKKGLDDLITAFAGISRDRDDLVLAIAGNGEGGYVSRLQRQAASLGLSERSVTWTGPLYGDMKWAALQAAELLVLPSHQENFGIALVEALAVGTPVCTTTSVNIWRELAASNAALVCEDNSESLSGSLRQWLSMSPEQRTGMRRNAALCFTERYRIEQTSQGLLSRLLVASERDRSAEIRWAG